MLRICLMIGSSLKTTHADALPREIYVLKASVIRLAKSCVTSLQFHVIRSLISPRVGVLVLAILAIYRPAESLHDYVQLPESHKSGSAVLWHLYAATYHPR
ncbi:hypothetical protein F5146DRAFT_56107 [Armillaria mellea]|nr:hypothetical protein F5146DRAFT_56107 [Armillaria mellea]